MRLLKQKIQKSIKALIQLHTTSFSPLLHSETFSTTSKESVDKEITDPLNSPSSLLKKGIQKTKKELDKSEIVRGYGTVHYSAKSTKNIVKNYSRAICNFCCGKLANPYLEDFFKSQEEKKFDLRDFRRFVGLNKKTCDSIDRFRNMFMKKEGEQAKYSKYKEVFRYLSEVFLKYFSVNWVYSGRLQHKSAHLSYRCKLLRRIKNPELFTHLKSFQKTKK